MLLRLFCIFFFSQLSARLVACQDEAITNEENPEETTTFPENLLVTSWNDMPFSGVEMENGTWVGKGYAFILFDMIRDKLNFSYSIIPPREQVLGNENTGILGLLYQKKVDIAVAFLPILPEMRRFCAFSTALDESRLTALMKRPQASATGSGLLAPFHQTVWLLILAAMLSFAPVIYIFAMIRRRLWNDPNSEKFTIASCMWFVYNSLLKQGPNIVAETDSTRMLFATWWMFILILSAFYTANLTAFLTKPQFTLSISSLPDIVKGGYSWVTYKGRTIDFLLSQPIANELSMLNSTARRRGNFKYNEPSTGILSTVSTSKLFLAEAHYLQILIFDDYKEKTRKDVEHSQRCTYVIMPGSILASKRAFAYPLDSSIQRVMNTELLKLVEGGIVKYTKEKDLPLAEVCPVDLQSKERRLRNADLLLTYKAMGFGYCLGAAVLLLEIVITLVRKCKQRQQQKHAGSHSKDNGELFHVNGMKDFPLGKKEGFEENGSGRHWHGIESSQTQFINGRDYIVMGSDGGQRLIPVRTPSAFLFQYTA